MSGDGFDRTAQLFAANDDAQGILVCLLGNDTAGYALAQAAPGDAAVFALQRDLGAQSTFANEPAGSPRVVQADVPATRVGSADFTLAP